MEYISISIIITPLRENLFIIIMKYVTTQDEIKQKKQYGMILNTDSNNNNGFQHFVMSNQFPTYIKDAIHIIEHVNQIKEYHLRIVNIEHIVDIKNIDNIVNIDHIGNVVTIKLIEHSKLTLMDLDLSWCNLNF